MRFPASWGSWQPDAAETRSFGWIDVVIVLAAAGAMLGLVNVAQEWTGQLRPVVDIDLSPWSLPLYTFYSLCRGLTAYVFSLLFTLGYGYWAAKDPLARRFLLPLLDILQSIPVLGFMPGLVLALVALFPHSNIGLELAAVIMIFTGQAWNMTFSFYHSVRSVPQDQQEAATVYRFSTWRRFRQVELPFATIGLVWNSMLSMAGGWFFLMINEAFRLGDKDFRLPGLGSYMSVAVEQGRYDAMIWAIVAMALMIIALDQFFWRPVVVWAQKFRSDDAGQVEATSSWFLDLLYDSGIVRRLRHLLWRHSRAARLQQRLPLPTNARANKLLPPVWLLRVALFAGLFLALGYVAIGVMRMLAPVSWHKWLGLWIAGALTLARVLVATMLGTAWALPAGLAIGLSPRLSRLLQPVVQVVASFPAPMLFPMAVAVLELAHVGLGWGSIVLMLLGTQWYILFNVIAGATAIPADLREAVRVYKLSRWQRFCILYFPCVFAYLVTGWVTAAGGAWNASIVSEFVNYKDQELATSGLGAEIMAAAKHGDFPLLAASILTMSTIVVLFNQFVWRRFYRLAESRYSLNR